jgi:hypothetical protein
MMISTARRLAALPGDRGDRRHNQDERDELQELLVMLKQHQLGHGPGEPKRKNAEDPAAQELDMIGADTARFHVILLEHDPEKLQCAAAGEAAGRDNGAEVGIDVGPPF